MELTSEMRRLVIAARVVAFQDQGSDAIRELDRASEAFAQVVPWEDQPEPCPISPSDSYARILEEHDLMRRTLETIAGRASDQLQASQARGALANIGPAVTNGDRA